jgi:hypothetical protein
MRTIVVPRRLRGPPASGNGGCVCGLVAGDASVEVTLRAPPPLEVPLAFDGVTLAHEGAPIAAVAPIAEPLTAPPPVDFAAAVAASAGFRHRSDHPLSSCFVCGTAREDGLKIWPGPCAGGVAAPWVPDASVGDEDGRVLPEIVWGALDCPQYFGLGEGAPFMLLGRMAARIDRRPRVGERCVVRGWRIGGEGRKGVGGAALYAGDELLAVARGTWITVEPGRFGA